MAGEKNLPHTSPAQPLYQDVATEHLWERSFHPCVPVLNVHLQNGLWNVP